MFVKILKVILSKLSLLKLGGIFANAVIYLTSLTNISFKMLG